MQPNQARQTTNYLANQPTAKPHHAADQPTHNTKVFFTSPKD